MMITNVLIKMIITSVLIKMKITIVLTRFLSVLICLIFSVLSTIRDYAGFADQTLFWMVSEQKSNIRQTQTLRNIIRHYQMMRWICSPNIGGYQNRMNEEGSLEKIVCIFFVRKFELKIRQFL